MLLYAERSTAGRWLEDRIRDVPRGGREVKLVLLIFAFDAGAEHSTAKF